MPEYIVIGTERLSGKAKSYAVKAASPADAIVKVDAQGVAVSSVMDRGGQVYLGETPQVQQQQQATSATVTSSAIASGIAGGVWRIIQWIIWGSCSVALLCILLGYVFKWLFG